MKARPAIAAALLAATSIAFAQTYPNRPVRLVAPYAAGGSSSAAAKVVSQKFQEITGQPMLVDYRPGAAGNIGGDMVAKAAPDGYTLLMGTSSLAINPSLYRGMTFDPIKDLAPVIILFRAPNVLAVHPSMPVRSVKDLIEYARARPGQLNYGSSGYGATNHMAMELLKTMAGLDIVHVPFKGGGESMPALIGGQIQLMFSPASTLTQQDKAGRLRMIAVSGATRIAGLDLPTVAESGLPGFQSAVWFGLFAPAGTPAPVIARLNLDMNRVLSEKALVETLEKGGLEPVGGTAEELRKLLADDHGRWAMVVKATGIKID